MILTFLLGERTCALEVTPGRSYDMKLLPTYRLYLFGGGAANALAVQVSPTNIPPILPLSKSYGARHEPVMFTHT